MAAMLRHGNRRLWADLSPEANTLVRAFARRLKAWRLEKGLTLKRVATDLGLTPSIVCGWEHGQRFPQADHLYAITEHSGLPTSRLLDITSVTSLLNNQKVPRRCKGPCRCTATP